ncbi:hypothetical protein KUTeg_012682 [Tegillarca granosa]|uniref:Transcriptional coactivator p15 (PC4) C-terminal domain-containing protein n=1 Tax=Tegillarca granosa TaxID=220873 RepID=A0ABQ9F3J7_TEGGR|nr:hypothetical protein KUTeg_012682 [Tegillarca granosa]
MKTKVTKTVEGSLGRGRKTIKKEVKDKLRRKLLVDGKTDLPNTCDANTHTAETRFQQSITEQTEVNKTLPTKVLHVEDLSSVNQGTEEIIPEDKLIENCMSLPTQIQDNVDLCCIHLGDDRYVVAKQFNGKMMIHIRQYVRNKRGLYPSKVGIGLDLEKWLKLDLCCYRDVSECIESYKSNQNVDYRYHLGENVNVSIKTGFPVVHIRKWFLPEGQESVVPTRKGIALTFAQWYQLRCAIDFVAQLLKEQLATVTFCELRDDHLNQMGFFQCRRCNPNHYMDY